jgi:hypothetical protein
MDWPGYATVMKGFFIGGGTAESMKKGILNIMLG